MDYRKRSSSSSESFSSLLIFVYIRIITKISVCFIVPGNIFSKKGYWLAYGINWQYQEGKVSMDQRWAFELTGNQRMGALVLPSSEYHYQAGDCHHDPELWPLETILRNVPDFNLPFSAELSGVNSTGFSSHCQELTKINHIGHLGSFDF